MKNKNSKGLIYSKIDLFFATFGGGIFRLWNYINSGITKLVDLFFEAREKSKDLVGTNLQIAETHIQNNHLYDAIIRYKIILRMDKKNFQSMYGLGFVYFKLKNFKKSLQYLNLALQNTVDPIMIKETTELLEKVKLKME